MTIERVNTNDRMSFVDIAKALLIIAVVLGHSGAGITKYIFLFHMPAFFMISGSLFRIKKKNVSYPQLLWNKFIKYSVPYIAFAIFTIFVDTFIYSDKLSMINLIKTILKYIYSGRMVAEFFGLSHAYS